MKSQYTILAASVAALIPACIIGTPRPAYGEAGITDTPSGAFPDIGKVDGDVMPDWGDLEKKYGGNEPAPSGDAAKPAPDPAAAPDPAKPAAETPAPAAPDPDKPTGQPAIADPAKPAAPDPAKPAEGAPKPAAAPEAPKAPDPNAPAAPFDADDALRKLDAIQPKPNASQKTLDGFRDIKEITRAAVRRNKELEAKVADLEKQPKGDPALEAELQELREYRAAFEARNDPKVLEPLDKAVSDAEERVLKTLVEDEALKLPQEKADELKRVGFDSPEGQARINGMLKAVAETGNYLLFERVKKLFGTRDAALENKANKLAEISSKADGYWQARQQQEEAERVGWAKQADGKLIELFKDATWGHYMEVKEGMDPASKAAAEKHNTNLKEVVVPAIRAAIQSVYSRDPSAAMEYIFKAFAHDQKAQELTAAQTEIGQLKQRVSELEQMAAGVQRISDPTKIETAPKNPPAADAAADANLSAEQAADRYLEQKYGRR